MEKHPSLGGVQVLMDRRKLQAVLHCLSMVMYRAKRMLPLNYFFTNFAHCSKYNEYFCSDPFTLWIQLYLGTYEQNSVFSFPFHCFCKNSSTSWSQARNRKPAFRCHRFLSFQLKIDKQPVEQGGTSPFRYPVVVQNQCFCTPIQA